MVRSSQQKAGGVDWRIVLHRFADGEGTDHYSLAMLTVKERRGYMVRAIVSVGDWPRAREQVRELLQTVLVVLGSCHHPTRHCLQNVNIPAISWQHI